MTTTTSFLCFLLAAVILTHTTSSTATTTTTTDTYIYAVCSPAKFSSSSTYQTNLNSLFSSLTTSTTLTRYNNFTVPGSKPEQGVTVNGIFQCKGDLDQTTCSTCVSRAVELVGSVCPNAYSGSLMMDNCFVRYDNSSFLGVQEKSLVLNKCGPLIIGFDDQDALTRIGDVIGSLGSGGGSFRSGGVDGDVKGVAQCTGDLSLTQCQDCLSDAIGRLRSDCGMAQGGYVYLSKCYARFSFGGGHARNTPNFGGQEKMDDKNDNNGVGKTMAIIIGIVTLIILLVVFLAFLGKQCRKLQDEKWHC